jgi:GNAT superfamily N-acetyltransferase
VIRVRAATRDDARAMSDLLVASITALCVEDHQNRPDSVSRWLANKTPEGVLRWFDNPDNRIFVAERDEALAAAGAFNTAREIILNYVSPEHRLAGVSKALLIAMEAALGPGEATLSSTETARRFYRRMGWSEAGELEHWAGMVAYPMRKLLA